MRYTPAATLTLYFNGSGSWIAGNMHGKIGNPGIPRSMGGIPHSCDIATHQAVEPCIDPIWLLS